MATRREERLKRLSRVDNNRTKLLSYRAWLNTRSRRVKPKYPTKIKMSVVMQDITAGIIYAAMKMDEMRNETGLQLRKARTVKGQKDRWLVTFDSGMQTAYMGSFNNCMDFIMNEWRRMKPLRRRRKIKPHSR